MNGTKFFIDTIAITAFLHGNKIIENAIVRTKIFIANQQLFSHIFNQPILIFEQSVIPYHHAD